MAAGPTPRTARSINCLGCKPQHTLKHNLTAFCQPLIPDWCNLQIWQAAGSPAAEKKVNALWKQALAEYREPRMDPGALEQNDAFVARRISAGDERTDF